MYLTKLTDGSYRFDTASGKEITLTEFELLGLFQLAAHGSFRSVDAGLAGSAGTIAKDAASTLSEE